MSLSSRLRSELPAALGGLLFATAAPPTNFMPGVVLGLALLYFALAAPSGVRRAAFLAWLWATSAALLGMAFVVTVVARFTPLGVAGGVLALTLLASFQALSWAAGATLAQVLRSRFALPRPLAFATLVFTAVSLPGVITWSPAAVISPWPELIQLGEFIGERGVSFLLALAAAWLAAPLVTRFARGERATHLGALWQALAGAALLGVLWLHGARRIAQLQAEEARLPKLELGVVQAAVPAQLRWKPEAKSLILNKLRALTRRSEEQGAELTLWPEAAYPYPLGHELRLGPTDGRRLLGDGIRGPVLFGLITRLEDPRRRFNSATLIDGEGRLQTPQDKVELLWFGETIPFSESLPFLRRVLPNTGNLDAGERISLLTHGPARIGVLNCYEDTLPSMGRRVARSAPNLLVNVTNDAWFGPTAEPELHLRLSVLRAVEARRDLVRAVNLGVPAWIDRAGVVRARGDDNHESVLRVAAALNDTSPTLYTKAGDIPIWLGLLLSTLAAAVRSSKRTAAPLPELDITERDPSAP